MTVDSTNQHPPQKVQSHTSLRSATIAYWLTVFLAGVVLIVVFPQAAEILAPGNHLHLPVVAAILAFIAVRFPSAALGGIGVMVLAEPVMGLDVSRMNQEQQILSYYWLFLLWVLAIGAAINLAHRPTAPTVASS